MVDGTYGRKIVSAAIQDDAVTYAKMQNVSATSKVLGRISSGAGDVEELSAANIKTIYESNAETNAYIDSHNTLIGGITSTASEINKLEYHGFIFHEGKVSVFLKNYSKENYLITAHCNSNDKVLCRCYFIGVDFNSIFISPPN